MEIVDEQGVITKAAYVSSSHETQYRVINIILVVALCKTDWLTNYLLQAS